MVFEKPHSDSRKVRSAKRRLGGRAAVAAAFATALGVGASMLGAPVQATSEDGDVKLSNAVAVEAEADRQAANRGPVDSFSFQLPAEPWQVDATALREAAAKYESPSPGVHIGYFDDGTSVRIVEELRVDSRRASESTRRSGCTRSETAYPPTTPSVSTRSTGAFSLSAACASSDIGYVEAQSNECTWPFGCVFLDQGSGSSVTVPNNGNTVYSSTFACRNGTHDWRTEARYSVQDPIHSSTRQLSNFC